MADFEAENLKDFYTPYNVGVSANDFAEYGMIPHEFESSQRYRNGDLTDQQIEDLLDFESRCIYTTKPQVVVSLVGKIPTKIYNGRDHMVVMTDEGHLYTWGNNEDGQLGLPRKQTLKVVEFTSFQTEQEEKKDAHHPKRSDVGDSLDQGTQQSEENSLKDESGTDQEGVTSTERVTANQYIQLPLSPVTKQVHLNYVGVPQYLENV